MDELLLINVPWSQEFSGFEIKTPASGFQSNSYSSLKLLHLYSTDDKTSKLMVKRFSTVRDTQRGSELHGEEKGEEGEKGDQEEKRGYQKGREQANQ